MAKSAPRRRQRKGDVGPFLTPGTQRLLQRRETTSERSFIHCGQDQKTALGDHGLASSNTMWALPPPTPNALTPARRGPSLCQGRRESTTANGLSAKSICGLGRLKCSVGGSCR